jgi:hypothetical protein
LFGLLQFPPSWEKQVIKATNNTFLHFLERLTMRYASNGEGSVHHLMAQGVCHFLDVTLPKAYREIVKRKTTEIFKILDDRNLHPQPTDMDMLGNVHRVAWKCIASRLQKAPAGSQPSLANSSITSMGMLDLLGQCSRLPFVLGARSIAAPLACKDGVEPPLIGLLL